MSMAAGFFRSSRIDRRLRDSGSIGGNCCRPERSGRSIRSTSAPRSARTMQPNGAGARLATSITLTPPRGPVRVSTPLACHASHVLAPGAGPTLLPTGSGVALAGWRSLAGIVVRGTELGEGDQVRGALAALDP